LQWLSLRRGEKRSRGDLNLNGAVVMECSWRQRKGGEVMAGKGGGDGIMVREQSAKST
jgi:hypothetical protein